MGGGLTATFLTSLTKKMMISGLLEVGYDYALSISSPSTVVTNEIDGTLNLCSS
jgi:hypothetical protein